MPDDHTTPDDFDDEPVVWSYRMVRHTGGGPSIEGIAPEDVPKHWFAVHEVDVDEDGNVLELHSEPAEVYGWDPSEIAWTIGLMFGCFQYPVFDAATGEEIGTMALSADTLAELGKGEQWEFLAYSPDLVSDEPDVDKLEGDDKTHVYVGSDSGEGDDENGGPRRRDPYGTFEDSRRDVYGN